MTNTKSKGTAAIPKPKRVKLRAMQKLYHGDRIVEEGEVFWFKGPELPAEEIAVPVDKGERLGPPAAEPVDPNAPKPDWTTQGYVDRATREAGPFDEDDEE